MASAVVASRAAVELVLSSASNTRTSRPMRVVSKCQVSMGSGMTCGCGAKDLAEIIQSDVECGSGVCQRADADAIDPGCRDVANGLEIDAARSFEKDSGRNRVAPLHRCPQLPRSMLSSRTMSARAASATSS